MNYRVPGLVGLSAVAILVSCGGEAVATPTATVRPQAAQPTTPPPTSTVPPPAPTATATRAPAPTATTAPAPTATASAAAPANPTSTPVQPTQTPTAIPGGPTSTPVLPTATPPPVVNAPTATQTLPTATPVGPASTPGPAKTITIEASRDAPLFTGSPDAGHAGDPSLFVGRTRMGDVRRAMVAFDVAGAIPAGTKITSVKLRMTVDKTHPGGQPMGVHRVTAEWAETASWNNRQPGVKWAKAGGDFAATASATTPVSGQLDGLFPQIWESATLVADVQGWLDSPGTNSGWMLIGAEGLDQSVKRFISREGGKTDSRPTLFVTFTEP